MSYGQNGGSQNYSIPLVRLRQKVFRLDHPDVIWFISDTIAKGRNIEIKELCDKNGYHYVWFCETIEEVYLGEKIPNKEKVNAAKKFLNKGIIPKDKLEKTELKKGTSNFKLVADSYFGKTSQIKE